MPHASFLLPARERFGGQRLAPEMGRALGRGDHSEAPPVLDETPGTAGKAQLRRHFRMVPDHWPLAALTRRVDAGDADSACWLRADPAHLRAGINGATLLAVGDMLQLSAEDSEALLRPLRPLFGDTGFTIDAPLPGHWYLRLPREAKPPVFVEANDALGADVFEHLPEGDAGRRWRSLLSEAQVTLHHHPVNAARVAAGQLPVNSLWFWGAGILPDHVSSPHAAVQSDDEAVRALAHGAATPSPLADSYAPPEADTLFDLRHARDLQALQAQWLQPALQDLVAGRLQSMQLDFEDGHIIDLNKRQRWRFWRKPMPRMDA